MSLIEGIGDEVIEFFIASLVVTIGALAWWSTRIVDRPTIRTVLVFERRSQNRRSSRNHNNQNSNNSNRNVNEQIENSNVENVRPTAMVNATQVEVNKPPDASTSVDSDVAVDGSGGASESSILAEEEEQNTIVENMDSETSVLRRRRIDFFENRDNLDSCVSEELITSDSESACVKNEDIKTVADNSYHVEETDNVMQAEPADVNDITVKLKYINDDLRLVNGKLQEPLGDFKKRNFQPELTDNKLVKLIFNGQVLQRDDVTLQGCGLFDNCVVHCLVHPKRSSPMDSNPTGGSVGNDGTSMPNHATSRSRTLGSSSSGQHGRDWDLGNLFFALVTFILGAAWYFRYEYAQLYTVTTTVALVGLTAMFTVLLVAMYYPDPEPPVQTSGARS